MKKKLKRNFAVRTSTQNRLYRRTWSIQNRGAQEETALRGKSGKRRHSQHSPPPKEKSKSKKKSNILLLFPSISEKFWVLMKINK